mmetsp:Transcript_4909/g.8808  ORF Transcript_4909/g.8808 Transcript_4909/m.8808 type:complete len:109 (+) Transcript_4909:97-423(+)
MAGRNDQAPSQMLEYSQKLSQRVVTLEAENVELCDLKRSLELAGTAQKERKGPNKSIMVEAFMVQLTWLDVMTRLLARCWSTHRSSASEWSPWRRKTLSSAISSAHWN